MLREDISVVAQATACPRDHSGEHLFSPNPLNVAPVNGRRATLNSLSHAPRVNCDGPFLRVNGRRFWIKGVTYRTFAPNQEGEPYPPIEVVRADFEQMRAAGFNTVRLYTPPSTRLADAAAEAGLYLLPDICWGPRRCELDSSADVRFMREWLREHAGRLAGHPAILMYSLGNEIPLLMVR